MKKRIAVFLDQTEARLISIQEGVAAFEDVVESPYTGQRREPGEGSDDTRFTNSFSSFSNNEFSKNRIMENELNSYYKQLESRLESYDEILLFGPGQAKKELRNRMDEMVAYRKKEIRVENCDRMTDNQLLEFVRNQFT
ncbi:MAG: hypothetical protein IAE67_08795 [Candidatus Competibacteraceae bacterium]|nr:hypothetical protein [Candidatus Competibacteraceae bacterium]